MANRFSAIRRKGEKVPMLFLDEKTGIYTDFSTGRCSADCGETEKSYDERLLTLNEETEKIYIQNRNSVKEYLAKRGLTDEDCERFGIGAATDIIKPLKEKGFTEEEMIKAGLCRKKEKVYPIFFNRLMFSIREENGRVVGFGGRNITDSKICKYLNTPENVNFHKRDVLYMYHMAQNADCSSFILCEGYMDVITMHKFGFVNTVASLGTALTKGQAKLLSRKPHIYVMFDSDEAGEKAAKRNLPILIESGLLTKVVDLSPYKDPDEFLRAEGREKMVERFRKATPGIDFLRENYKKGDDPEIFKVLLGKGEWS